MTLAYLFVFINLYSFYSFNTESSLLVDIDSFIPRPVINLISLLLVIPAYFSLSRTFGITEPSFKRAVKGKDSPFSQRTERISFVLKTPYIYLETFIVSFFTNLMPKDIRVMQLTAILPESTPRIVYTLIITFGVFIIGLFSRMNAIEALTKKVSFEDKLRARGETKYNLWYLARMTALLLIAYPLAASAVLYTICIAVIPFLFSTKDTVIIILLILAIVVPLAFIRTIKTVSIRKKFIKKLEKLCKQNKFRIEERNAMVRSALIHYSGYNFLIHANGKTYACKLIGSKKKKNPMYFTQGGELYEVRKKSFTFIGFGVGASKLANMELSQKATVSDYTFESEYTKVLILNPIPYYIFAGHPDHAMAIDTGSRVGDYLIFNGSGFMNALERDCVEGRSKY